MSLLSSFPIYLFYFILNLRDQYVHTRMYLLLVVVDERKCESTNSEESGGTDGRTDGRVDGWTYTVCFFASC